jgi:hypothetical protein
MPSGCSMCSVSACGTLRCFSRNVALSSRMRRFGAGAGNSAGASPTAYVAGGRDPATSGTWTRCSSGSQAGGIICGVPWIRMASCSISSFKNAAMPKPPSAPSDADPGLPLRSCIHPWPLPSTSASPGSRRISRDQVRAFAVRHQVSGNPQRAITILRPLADGGSSSARVRHDLAVALALAGDDEEAAHVLSVDMRPHEAADAVAGIRNMAGGGE